MLEPRLQIVIDADLKDLVPGYLTRRRNDLKNAQDALLIDNYIALQKIGQKIRGSAGGYGFCGLAKIADRLERAAAEQNTKALHGALDDMRTYLERISVSFKR